MNYCHYTLVQLYKESAMGKSMVQMRTGLHFRYFERLACLGMVLDFNLQAVTVNDIYEMTTEGGDA